MHVHLRCASCVLLHQQSSSQIKHMQLYAGYSSMKDTVVHIFCQQTHRLVAGNEVNRRDRNEVNHWVNSLQRRVSPEGEKKNILHI